MYCKMICKGDWEKHALPDMEELRRKHRPELTEEQKADKDAVSVIIPACKEDVKYLQGTIDSVRKNACGPIEIIAIFDGIKPLRVPKCAYGFDKNITFDKPIGPVGHRKAMNVAASYSIGKYLLRLDCHCALSEGWDARMKSSCGAETIVKPMADRLIPETWKGEGVDIGFTAFDENLHNYWCRRWKDMDDRKIEEECMSLWGFCWMIRADWYRQLGGCDESLGSYGVGGPEWALKAWRTGGKVILRTDTVCYHLWRKKAPYPIHKTDTDNAFEKLKRDWVCGQHKRPMNWLLYKFAPYMKKSVLHRTMSRVLEASGTQRG